MPRIPVQLTPAEADTLGATVALLERLERLQSAGLRLDTSAWEGVARGQAKQEFRAAATAVSHVLITAAVSGECSEAQRVLDAMDAASEAVAAEVLS